MAKIGRFYKGKLWELSFSESNKSYYTMYPLTNVKKGQRKTKRKWLGGDEVQSETAFTLFWDDIEGTQKTFIPTEADIITTPFPHFDMQTGKPWTNTVKIPIEDKHYFNWLRNKITNKEFDYLAKGTGYANLTKLPNILNSKDHIPLSEMLDNWLHKKNTVSDHEVKYVKRAFLVFTDTVQKDFIEQITLADIKKVKVMLDSIEDKEEWKKKTYNQYATKMKYPFESSNGKYNDNTKIAQICNWLDKHIELYNLDSLKKGTKIQVELFNQLYDNADIKMKAMMMFALNTASYPIVLQRTIYKGEDAHVDFKRRTFSIRRGKKGRIQKVSTLWMRTVKVCNAYLNTRKDDCPYLFMTRNGTKYGRDGISLLFSEFRERYDIDKKITFRRLRDTFKTVACAIGYKQESNFVLGHSRGSENEYIDTDEIRPLTEKMCKAVEKNYFGK